jgi:hypothetical protein
MKRTIAAAILFLAFVAIPFQAVHASLHSAPQLNDQRPIVLKLSDLRSAYLQRAGVVGYDKSKLSPEGLRQQLQRHFDVVIGLLLVSTPRSVDTALARLEAADGHTWSAGERADQRQRLLAMRYLQLRRLAAYRDRGQFPLNEGQADHAVPIFVDRHDTACAVGQLMRWSGWLNDVAAIHRDNNLVYVPDASKTSVAAWALTSGITVEEAALVQPGYPLVATNLIGDYGPGELSFVKDGLKYQNFQITAQNYTIGPLGSVLTFHQLLDFDPNGGFFVPTLGGRLPSSSSIGFNAGSNFIPTPFFFDMLDPPGNRWLLVGGSTSLSFANPCPCYPVGGYSQPDTIQRITLTFDVSTIDANTFIDQFGEYSNPGYGGFYTSGFSNYQGQYEITTTVEHLGSLYGTTNFQEQPGGAWGVQNASAFLTSKTNSLSVTSTIWLYNGTTIDSFVLEFNVVPEPTSAFLTVIGLIGFGFRSSLWRRTS